MSTITVKGVPLRLFIAACVVQFGQLTGLEPTSAPLAGAIRIDNLDEQSFIVVRRRLEQDRLQLVTIGKELSFARGAGHVAVVDARHRRVAGRPKRRELIR